MSLSAWWQTASSHFATNLLLATAMIRLFQWKWEAIVAALGTNPYTYRVLFGGAFVTLLYLGLGSLFAILDLTLSPKVAVQWTFKILGQKWGQFSGHILEPTVQGYQYSLLQSFVYFNLRVAQNKSLGIFKAA